MCSFLISGQLFYFFTPMLLIVLYTVLYLTSMQLTLGR